MPDISLNSVTLTRGRMTFTDRFVKPNYVAELSSIDGSISAVSSSNPQPAKVKVTGRVTPPRRCRSAAWCSPSPSSWHWT